MLSLSIYVLIVLALTWCVKSFVFTRAVVDGSSMENTLQNGDNLIVNRMAYRLGAPERFDIIVFPYKYQKNTYYIKRIIGLPGETVHIDESGVIYINGNELKESYGREVITDAGAASGDVVLGSDEYFVMGDNRNDSNDSRMSDVGNIHRKEITGKAVLRIWPLEKISQVK